MNKIHHPRTEIAALYVAATVLAIVSLFPHASQAQTFGDVTDELIDLGNPPKFGMFPDGNVPDHAWLTYDDMDWHNGRLFFAYGNESVRPNNVRRPAVSYDPATSSLILESPRPGFTTEGWARVISKGGSLYLMQNDPIDSIHDVDILTPSNRWVSAKTIRTAHVYNLAIYGGYLWIGGAIVDPHNVSHDMLRAPIENPSGNFTPYTTHSISQFLQPDRLVGSTVSVFFEFRNRLYFSVAPQSTLPGQMRMAFLYYDKNEPAKGWQAARPHGARFMPQGIDNSRMHNALPVKDRLLFTAMDAGQFKTGLFVCDDIENGTATRVNLPYGDANIRRVTIAVDNDVAYALISEGYNVVQPNRLYRCTNIAQMHDAASWEFVLQFKRRGINHGQFSYRNFTVRDDIFYVGESYSDDGQNTATAGTLWSYPIGQRLTAVADTHVRRGDPTVYGGETAIAVKGERGLGSNERLGLIRFDTSSLKRPLGYATLRLQVAQAGGVHSFRLAGVNENVAEEAFSESALHWNNSGLTNASDAGFNPAAVTDLGSFDVTADGEILEISGPALVNFLNANTDSHLTFLIYRTSEASPITRFASRESSTPPMLFAGKKSAGAEGETTSVADTFLRRGSTQVEGSSPTIDVKGVEGVNAFERLGLVRFAPPASKGALSSATLSLDVVNSGTFQSFELLGVKPGNADRSFDETGLHWNNSALTDGSDSGYAAAEVTPLGTFAVHPGQSKVSITSGALADFISANPDADVSLMIARTTGAAEVTSFASKENPTMRGPTLTWSTGGIFLEAESHDNTTAVAPFVRLEDPAASGGAFMVAPNGNNSLSGAPSDSSQGRLEYSFSLSERVDGLQIWARVNFPSTADDSFHYKLDGAETSFNTRHAGAGAGWSWILLKTYVELEPGPLTLRVVRREDGTQLDAFYISTDGSKPPGFMDSVTP